MRNGDNILDDKRVVFASDLYLRAYSGFFLIGLVAFAHPIIQLYLGNLMLEHFVVCAIQGWVSVLFGFLWMGEIEAYDEDTSKIFRITWQMHGISLALLLSNLGVLALFVSFFIYPEMQMIETVDTFFEIILTHVGFAIFLLIIWFWTNRRVKAVS